MEILVALGVLSIAIGSILSIFVTGSRFGARAQEKTEAGRLALAVVDLVDRGFIHPSGPWGRQLDGKIPAGPTEILSEDLLSSTELDGVTAFWAYAPAYVIRSPLDFVWRCKIDDHNLAGTLHRVEVTIAMNEWDQVQGIPKFDTTNDREVVRYHALLADR